MVTGGESPDAGATSFRIDPNHFHYGPEHLEVQPFDTTGLEMVN